MSMTVFVGPGTTERTRLRLHQQSRKRLNTRFCRSYHGVMRPNISDTLRVCSSPGSREDARSEDAASAEVLALSAAASAAGRLFSAEDADSCFRERDSSPGMF